jgi:hypothetical protein
MVRIEHSVRQDYIVLTLAGRLDLAAAPRIQRVLLKHLSDQPPAVICDLSRVEAIDPCAPASSPPPAIARSAGQPPAWCCAVPGQRSPTYSLSCGCRTSCRCTRPWTRHSLTRARARPPYLSEQLRLGPVPSAPAMARAFVHELCQRWQLLALARTAMLLTSELVTNAAVHARTPLELRLELRGERLTIAARRPSGRKGRVVRHRPA